MPARKKANAGAAERAQPGATCNCLRCKKLCRVAESRDEKSYPFRLSKVAKGFCAECIMTQFLYETYPINWIIDERGPEMLLNREFMTMAFNQSGLMQHCPDMGIASIDWQRVVDNWNLPVKVNRDGRNPYRMGDATRRKEAPTFRRLGFFGGEKENLPPGARMSGGTLIVDGEKLRAEGNAETPLGNALLGLLDVFGKEQEP